MLSCFVTVIIVIDEFSSESCQLIKTYYDSLKADFYDFEVLVVSSETLLARSTAQNELLKLSSIRLLKLAKSLDFYTSVIAGIDNSIGDYICVIDKRYNEVGFVTNAIKKASDGYDIVYGINSRKSFMVLSYLESVLNNLVGIDMPSDISRFRILSRRVANFIEQSNDKARLYRVLPGLGGFRYAVIQHSCNEVQGAKVFRSLRHGMYLLVHLTNIPLRIVTISTVLSSALSLIYIVYVIIVAVSQEGVAKGWMSISLGLAGMMLLISIILMIMSEYIFGLVRNSQQIPPYMVVDDVSAREMPEYLKTNVLR